MRIRVVTLFPELFESPLRVGLLGKALAEGRAEVGYVDPRSYATDRHRSVDDAPYGGGAGMVMKVDVLAPAIEEARRQTSGGRAILLCPQGTPFDQAAARRLAAEPGLVLVAGRYEGFDERVRELVDEELSLGDFVLTGGEYAALAIIDAVVRLQPGTLGNAGSALADSFEAGLLEHPHYTRPSDFRGATVPELLLGGDHAKVAAWRRRAALLRTRARRPDLLAELELDPAARLELLTAPPRTADLHLAFVLTRPEEALACLELAAVYALSAVELVAPTEALRGAATRAVAAWAETAGPAPLRKGAKARSKVAHTWAAARAARRRRLGDASRVHASLEALVEAVEPASWIVTAGEAARAAGPRALREELLRAPAGARYVLALGQGFEAQGEPRIRLALGRTVDLDSGITGVIGVAVRLDRLLSEA